MNQQKLGPWPLGLCNRFPDTQVPAGALLVANNVDIDRVGEVESRRGFMPASDTVTCLHEHESRKFGLKNGAVGEIKDGAFVPRFTVGTHRVSWGKLDGHPMFVYADGVGRIVGDTAYQLGTATAFAPMLTLAPGRSAQPGTYAVSATLLGDGEGGSSASAFITVPPGFGFDVHLPPIPADAVAYNLYMSRPNGDALFAVAKLQNSHYQVSTTPDYGRPLDTLGMVRVAGGDYVRQWRGRLLLARGRVLFYSPPYRYGLINPRSSFVRFNARIAFVEPVDGGVYVGLVGRGTVFLAGESPESWVQKPANDAKPQEGASAVVGTAQMDEKFRSAEEVAVWFTESGFAVGMPNGQVVLPQGDRLSGLPLGTGSLAVRGDRLIVLSQ